MRSPRFFETYLSVVLTAGVGVLGFIYVNISDLNQKMAVVVEKVSQHDSMIQTGNANIEGLEHRVRDIEVSIQRLSDGQLPRR